MKKAKCGAIAATPDEWLILAGGYRRAEEDVMALLAALREIEGGANPIHALLHAGTPTIERATLMWAAECKAMGPVFALATQYEQVSGFLCHLAEEYHRLYKDANLNRLKVRRGAPPGSRKRTTSTEPRATAPDQDAPAALESVIATAKSSDPSSKEIEALRSHVRRQFAARGTRTTGEEAERAIEKRAQALHRKLRRHRVVGVGVRTT